MFKFFTVRLKLLKCVDPGAKCHEPGSMSYLWMFFPALNHSVLH